MCCRKKSRSKREPRQVQRVKTQVTFREGSDLSRQLKPLLDSRAGFSSQIPVTPPRVQQTGLAPNTADTTETIYQITILKIV